MAKGCPLSLRSVPDRRKGSSETRAVIVNHSASCSPLRIDSTRSYFQSTLCSTSNSARCIFCPHLEMFLVTTGQWCSLCNLPCASHVQKGVLETADISAILSKNTRQLRPLEHTSCKERRRVEEGASWVPSRLPLSFPRT